jgi:AraC-like DNA-binding protein
MWVSSLEAVPEDHQGVLPDGCLDIICAIGPEPFVAGPDTEARQVGTAAEMLIGVRFLPGVAAALLGVPVSEITNQTVPLSCVWRPAEVRALRGRVGEASSPREMAERLEEHITRRMRRSAEPDPLVRGAIHAILRATLNGSRTLERRFDISERHLRRRFVASVGYGPKTFERIARFRYFMRIAQIYSDLGLAGLAAEAGYADQSHLTRECVRLSGRTPHMILDTTPTSDLFKTVEQLTVTIGAWTRKGLPHWSVPATSSGVMLVSSNERYSHISSYRPRRALLSLR